MKLQILSDLHLEFHPFEVPKTDADAILLAGDIGTGTRCADFAIKTAKEHKKPVIFVTGNHDYYKTEYFENHEAIKSMAENSEYPVYFLSGNTLRLPGFDDYVFWGHTMWTDFKFYSDHVGQHIEAMEEIKNCMSDYFLIRDKGAPIHPYFTAARFNEARLSLDNLLINFNKIFSGKKLIVMTHHLPSALSVDKKYRGSNLNPAFASNLDEYLKPPVALWVHGHTHHSCDYMTPGGARVVCNPHGYYQENQHGFNPNFIVEV